MISEPPTIPGFLANDEPSQRHRIDPIRLVVQGTLALYLLPVVLLVAAIGVSSIVISRSVSWIATFVNILTPGPNQASRFTPRLEARVIGSRPIVRLKSKRSRVIR